MTTLPEEWPLLEGKDMWREDFSNKEETRYCLYGHCNKMLWDDPCPSNLGDMAPAYINIKEALEAAIFEATGCSDQIAEFNDDHPYTVNARIWNRAGYLLGYTEDNPEKKPVGLGRKL